MSKLNVNGIIKSLGGGDDTLYEVEHVVSKLLDEVETANTGYDNDGSNYLVLGSGLIINWGKGNNTANTYTAHYFSYPYSDEANYVVVTTPSYANTTEYTVGRSIIVRNKTTTYFETFATTTGGTGGAGTGFYWVAIGK